MSTISHAVTFFDIGETLGSVRLAPGQPQSVELRVFPDVPPVLETLRAAGVRLGIISNPGSIAAEAVNAALADSNLLDYFDRTLIIYGPKDSPRIFEQAAATVHHSDDDASTLAHPTLLFVGEDASERSHARDAGFLVAPHPKLALTVLQDEGPLSYLRISIPPAADGDWRATLRALPLVPLHLALSPTNATSIVYAVASAATAAHLDDLGFWVDRLGVGNEPLTSDLYILRDDQQVNSGFLAAMGNSAAFFQRAPSARQVLTSTHEGLFVAVPAGRSVESYHFAGARHGHNLKLTPSLALLETVEPETNLRLAGAVNAMADLATPTLTATEISTLEQHITPEQIERDVARYTGVQPVSGSVAIVSRHIHHRDNALAVQTLADDFIQMGNGHLIVRTHPFTHEGQSYSNVEATLPGSGLEGVVLVTAHLDSTGARQAGYRPALDPAPGADDDASGTIGVLAAARTFLTLADAAATPRREIRFVLFNAEEHGLIGSKAYASEQAKRGVKIVAVFQMDMIGYDVNPTRSFELHAGFTRSPSVEDRSTRLAELIATLLPQVSPNLPVPQFYPGSNGQPDPAEARSDHYSFQQVGYAACLASEDLFVGPEPTTPAPEPNPNYHMPADGAINAAYAADIARAVAAAAWVSATR